MRTQSKSEETTGKATDFREESDGAEQGDLLDAGLQRDQRWRELRRKSLQSELRALDRAPRWAALIVFSLIAVAMGGWMLYSIANGTAVMMGPDWLGLILTPLMVGIIPAMLTRTLMIGVCQGLRRIILRRAANNQVFLSPDERIV